MSISVEVIEDSVGPNGIRLVTCLGQSPRFIHSEHLRHRAMSFSVASSRAIPAKKLMEQVENDPAMPILWPKQHKGMQGSEVVTEDRTPLAFRFIHNSWLNSRNKMVEVASNLSKGGLSKQITNRLIEPWVTTRCVFTATEWDGFFRLRHPWHNVTSEHNEEDGCHTVWEDEVNLEFPAEYNIQKLAIETKKAMDASEPRELAAGEWHLPFITEEERENEDPDFSKVMISASRCAMTSYNHNQGRDWSTELDLAGRLMKDKHWSPFEHQARAISACPIPVPAYPAEAWYRSMADHEKGLELRYSNNKWSLWSRNFRGWIQARAMEDN